MTRATGAFGGNGGGDGRTPANTRSFTPRRSDTPRKVRGGIKLQGTLEEDITVRSKSAGDSELPGVGPALRLLASVQSMIDPTAWAEGLIYARAGQIVSIDFQHGSITAHVQGTAGRPYLTQIQWPVFTEEQWQRVVEFMANEAGHVAKLLAGAWPTSIEQRLESQGLPLLPSGSNDIVFSCTCRNDQSSASPHGCKHLAAAALLAAETLASHPLHLFTVRGRSPELLMDHLRSARMVHPGAGNGRSVEARSSPLITDAPPAVPLEACLDDFWRSPMLSAMSDQLSEVQSHGTPSTVPAVPHVPHALLRRMGPSPMNGRFPMVGLLASVYDEVSAAARRMRDGDTSESAATLESPAEAEKSDQ